MGADAGTRISESGGRSGSGRSVTGFSVPDVETVDHSDPRDVVAAIELSRATYRKMIQKLIWATAYNLFAIPVAGGLLVRWGLDLRMSIGAVAMSLSTIIVASCKCTVASPAESAARGIDAKTILGMLRVDAPHMICAVRTNSSNVRLQRLGLRLGCRPTRDWKGCYSSTDQIKEAAVMCNRSMPK
jgi:hypothetical protein